MDTNTTEQHTLAKREKLKIIDWLVEHFPAAFFKRTRQVRPLKLGILEDIFEFHYQLDTPPFSKKAIRNALTYYCTSPAYLSAQKEHQPRIDLFGNEMEVVTAEQAKYARQRYERQYLSPKTKKIKQAFEQPEDN
ncbi:MAG: ProQ/FinO family protein [Legionellaceae bacterium]|nr:ProQ/FinO family protein [Legionellaceae bacterium]